MRRAAAILLCCVLSVTVEDSPAQAWIDSGQAVDFTLPQLHGGEVALSGLRGDWVVLNYWATWCAPCREEIPELSLLHSERDDVAVLGLAFEEPEFADFDAFLADFQPSYPILLVDVLNPPAPFGAPKVLPTTIVLDPDGRPRKAFSGPITREDVESWIDSQGSP